MKNDKNDKWILKILRLVLFGKNETNKGSDKE